MRPLHLPPLPALIALVLLASCRDASETLVGPPDTGPDFAEIDLGGKRGVTLDVNDSSVAVGWLEGNRAFRWKRGGPIQSLGTLGGNYSRAAFINARGQITGVSTTADGKPHVFLWRAGVGMRSLGTLGGSELVVTALSDSGHVVGWGTQANGSRTGFVAREGTSLQLIPGYPTDVNSAGTVVGRTGATASPPFRWTAAGGVQSLPNPWGSLPWQMVPQVNNAGIIAGLAMSGGVPTVVRLRPTGTYQMLNGCWVYPADCTMAAMALNEHGAVAWALTQNWGASWLYHWGLDGGTAQTPLAVIPASLVLGDDGGVAGTGRSPGTTTQRSFLWRRPGNVAYYRRSSQVHAINGVGDIVGSAAVLTGTHATKLWNERPTWFNAAENHPPLANPGKYEVLAGEPIVMDVGQSTDPDGDALRAYWGGFVDPLCCWRRRPPVGHAPTAIYTFTAPGTFEITLTVADADSLYSTQTSLVQVHPNPPVSTRYGPYVAEPGQAITFDGRRADDPAGTRYRYSWSFDTRAPRAVVSKAFATPGYHNVTLQIRDAQGALVEMVHTRAEVAPALEFRTPDRLVDPGPFDISFEGPEYFNYNGYEFSFACHGAYSAWSTMSLYSCFHYHRGPPTRTLQGRVRNIHTGRVWEFVREVTARYPFCYPEEEDCSWP